MTNARANLAGIDTNIHRHADADKDGEMFS